MRATNLLNVLRDTRRVQSEARCRRELEAARLAVFVSRCATCGVLYAVRLADPCDGAVYNVSDGMCSLCLSLSDPERERAWGDQA